MNILNRKKGEKIIYKYPNKGYTYERKLAEKRLVLNQIYTIERITIKDWHTDVYLQEFPSIKFNSVLFEDVNLLNPSERHMRYP